MFTKMFTREDYEHIKENTFNPGVCPECARISVNLESTPEILSDMYDMYEWITKVARQGFTTFPVDRKMARDILTKAEAYWLTTR